MAPAGKANYKSFEAQYRFVRAMVAAHPDVKWDYKNIVRCFGSDMTEHALNHKFRVLRAHAELINQGLKAGFDMKDLPIQPEGNPRTIDSVDKKNIAKYFGASTADGIQFQFRSIKQEAKMLKEAADSGRDPMSVKLASMPSGVAGASLVTTPSRSASRATVTPSTASRNRTTPRTATGRGKKVKRAKSEDDSDEIGSFDDIKSDHSEVDTPTRSRDKVLGGRVAKPTVAGVGAGASASARMTSSRAAAQNAAAAIQNAATVANEPSASESDVVVLDSEDVGIKTEREPSSSDVLFAAAPSSSSSSSSRFSPGGLAQAHRSQSRLADLPASVTSFNNPWAQSSNISTDNGLLEGEF